MIASPTDQRSGTSTRRSPLWQLLCLAGFGLAAAPAVIAQAFTEGLNNSATHVTASSGAYYTGLSAIGDRPATMPFAVEGTHAYGISNGTATITSNTINTLNGSAMSLSFRLASFSIGSSGNGADAADTVKVDVSPDGGTTWYPTLQVAGNANAYWAYSTGTGLASTAYDGDGTVVPFAPTGGGGRTTDGYSTVTVSNLPAVAAMRFRITMLNNASAERWVVDNIAFTGTFAADTTNPTISSLSPTDNATGVAITANLVATFSEPIAAGSGDIVIKKTSDNSVVATIPVGDPQVTIAGSTLTINPTADLVAGVEYFVQIAATAIDDLAGNSYDGISDTTSWSFTTVLPDTTNPAVASLSPLDDATGVAVGTNLVVTFTEPIQAGTGDIVIRKISDNSAAATIPVGDAQVTIAGSTMTINPTADLADSTGFYVEIAATAIDDLAGNSFDGISGATAWNFETFIPDTTNPTATLSPLDNAIDVAVRQNLVLAFDEPIAKGTGNIVIYKTSDNSVVETIDVTTALVQVAGSTAKINPAVNLPVGEELYVLVDATAFKDLANNFYEGISATTAWSFTTVTVDPALTINEIDADTPATDVAEFVEIYDGGVGNTPLDGYVLVFFNGAATTPANASYLTVDLTGMSTDANGFFVAGGAAVTNVDLVISGTDNLIQNGADAVGLYYGPAADYPNNTTPSTANLVDAVVYGNGQTDDADLLAALGQSIQHNENANSLGTTESLSRFADGTANIEPKLPTPGVANGSDLVPPVLASLNPLDNAVDVPVANDLVATFNESIQAGTGNILIKKSADDSVAFTIPVGDPQITITGNTLTINPATDLEMATGYYVQIEATAVEDTSGNPYAGLSLATAWNFVTTTIPTATVLSPADNASSVGIRTNLAITFSESVVAGTGNIEIRKTSDDSLVESIDVTTGQVVVSGSSVTVNPAANLALGTEYYIIVPATAFKDAADNHFAGITTTTGWSFTTVVTEPVLTINEIDADQAGTPDSAEFIEIYDGGVGNTPLDGYVLVLYNGNGDTSYLALDLDGKSTDANGFFVAGNSAVVSATYVFPNDNLQNGADAVALYYGNGSDFPNGSAPTMTELIDAVVYDTSDADDTGLLAALGQTVQYNENEHGTSTTFSVSRTPDGSATIATVLPTPGAPNHTAPVVTALSPVDNTSGVAVDTDLALTFDQAIAAGTGDIVIKKSSDNSVVATIPVGDPQVSIVGNTLTIDPTADLANGTVYHVLVAATAVKNASNQTYAGIADTTSWNFTTVAGGNTYANWIDGFYPGETDPDIIGFTADPDNDGIDNGLEALFGSAPDATSVSGITQLTKAGNTFTFRYPQAKILPTGMSASHEWSADMTGWNAPGATAGGLTVTITDTVVDSSDPEVDIHEVTATVTAGTTTTLFLRVVATTP